MTKNRNIDRGVERCRNFRNLYLSLPDARPVPAKVDPLQADVAATKWAAPSSLSRAGESRKRGRTSQLDPSDKAVGRAQPPHPNPLPQGEREPEVPSFKGVTAISTVLIQEVLDGLSTTHAEKLKSLTTLKFQRFDDVSLIAA